MRLNDEECKCATERSVFQLMNFLNWIQIILLVVAIVLFITTLLFARKAVVNEIRKRR
jgi:type II secretory pathway component PulF